MPDDHDNKNNNEGFVSRWSRRKRQVAQEESQVGISPNAEILEATETKDNSIDPEQLIANKLEALNKLTDEDMPDIETLDEHSDFSTFMSTSVTEGLRNLALKKLFMGASYNIRDGLDEYDGDYTKFEKMPTDMVTTDMKHMIGVEAKKQLAKEQEEERQRMIASGEIEEFDEVDEMDEFDEFAGEDDEDDLILEEYVDEHINVEGFDTTAATDEASDLNNSNKSDNSNNSDSEHTISESDNDNDNEEVA